MTLSENEQVRQSTMLMRTHFSLEEGFLEECTTFEQLEQRLTRLINQLLDKDMTRLLNAFYRIDISEDKFKKILTTESPSNIAKTLAQEVISRELKKVMTRQKYRE